MADTTTETSTQDQAKQATSEVASDAKSKADDVQQSAKAEARSVAHDVKDQAASVLGTARGELRTQASEHAKNLSGTLNDLSRQLGDMADGSNEPEAHAAQLARSAADTLSRRAQRIDQNGIDGVVDDVKRFARNRPGAFLLGSIAAGFAIGRLAKHADLKQAGQKAKGEVDTDRLKSDDDSADSWSPPTDPTTQGDAAVTTAAAGSTTAPEFAGAVTDPMHAGADPTQAIRP